MTPERVSRYLSDRLADGPVSVEQFRRTPASTREVVLCTASWDEDGERRTKDLVLRVKSGSAAEYRGRGVEAEYELLDSLAGTDVPVPEPLWFESDPDRLGGRLLATEQLPGESYRKSVPPHRRALERAWNAGERQLPGEYVEVLGAVHGLDSADLDGMSSRSSSAVIETELEAAAEMYDRVDDRYPVVDEAFRWLRTNAPEIPEATPIHGDLKLANLLVEDDRIAGVLDWELARESDPMFDLAYACCPLHAGPEFEVLDGAKLCLGLFEREWLFDRYEDATGRRVDRDRIDYWETYVLLTHVLILLQHTEQFVMGDEVKVSRVFPQYLLAPRMKMLLESLRT